MCGIHRCPVCNLDKEMCGVVCHSPICQIYLPLYFRKHKQVGHKGEFDPDVYMIAGGTW